MSDALSAPQARPRLQRGGSSASLHNSLMRNSIFQLMIHTLDPLSEGKMLTNGAAGISRMVSASAPPGTPSSC